MLRPTLPIIPPIPLLNTPILAAVCVKHLIKNNKDILQK